MWPDGRLRLYAQILSGPYAGHLLVSDIDPALAMVLIVSGPDRVVTPPQWLHVPTFGRRFPYGMDVEPDVLP